MLNTLENQMPELPEVETIKSALEESIGQTKIESIDIRIDKLRNTIPTNINKIIIGANIVKYERKAKYIVIYLDNGFCLLWHMGMSGKISIADNIPTNLNKHDHIIIKTKTKVLIYNDPRRFGFFDYCKHEELLKHRLFAKIGIEPLSNEFCGKYLYNKIKHKRIPIKATIMDQNIVVGIGNIYASEALFAAKISPLRPACEISLKECNTLVSEAKKTLIQAINAGGSTLRDYKKPDGSLGYFQNQHCVYQKTGLPCPNCTCNIKENGGIKKVIIAGRSTFYCSHKQK